MLQDSFEKPWTPGSLFLFRFSFVFVILFIFSFSFEHEFIPDPGKFFASFFEHFAAWTGKTFFDFSPACTYEIASDSAGFYMNALNLLVVSLLVAVAWSFTNKERSGHHKMAYWFFAVVRFYLAMQLFSYGFNKLFKWQFYLPEPNTLFTTIGNTPRDLLYWSSMGTSWSYTVFLGIVEILAAALLLFRRTYIAGALVAAVVLVHVLVINLGFNISVKLYSAFLLLLCMILLAPEAKKLFGFFFSGKTASLEKWHPAPSSKKVSRTLLVVKVIVIVAIILDPLTLYFRTDNFNDDLAARPPLHGAYEVKLFVKNSDTLLPLTTDNYRWRRMFVHRRGYLITQGMDDGMMSYELFVDTNRRKLMIKDGNAHSFLNYAEEKNTLRVDGVFLGDTLRMEMEKIDLTKLPLQVDEFQWMMDH
jgi:uncharacterized membrane protein YphA (DoxX/SURF4 family)